MNKYYIRLAVAVLLITSLMLLVACDTGGSSGGGTSAATDVEDTTAPKQNPVTEPPETDEATLPPTPDTRAPETDEVTSPPAPVTASPETDEVTSPPDYSEVGARSFTLTAETGTRLFLTADITTSEPDSDGNITVNAAVYLNYYTLFMGARNGATFQIGREVVNFSTAPFDEAENEPHSMLIAEATTVAAVGETVTVTVKWPFNGYYDDVQFGTLMMNDLFIAGK